MINYIIQVILFQILFLTIYDFFLSKETFFTKNRWYLLSTPILSFLLPLIKIPTFQKAVPQEYIVYLPEVVISPETVIQKSTWYQSINYIDIIFAIGVIVFTVVFLSKLIQIFKLINSYKLVRKVGYTLVLIPNQSKAFSFFNYIFLGEEIPENQKEQIIAHELVHSTQKHSLDLLLFEFLKIIMWFNPMIFIYQKRITLVHEYISDEVATKNEPKENYINKLLSSFFQVEDIAFINQFYKQTLIKKRIIMMKKKQSKKMNQLKYLVLIPVLMSMLFYTSCADNELKEISISKKEVQTMYRNQEGVLVSKKGKEETYLDNFIGREAPIGAKKISINDLSNNEREEYEIMKNIIDERGKDGPEFAEIFSFHLYKMPNGRNASAMLMKLDKTTKKTEKRSSKDSSVNILKIEKAPTFPGCEEGDKNCLHKNIQQHFSENFDTNLPNNLGLSTGKKRVFVGFKIDKNGEVIDLQARAPHQEIKEEVLRVMSSLPKMIPGENKDGKVVVSYNVPFTILVN
ncbi:M56 family metallopeptidase [Polaribacter sp. KT 15]|uniref:M56 family metallopeptidase n=1 Tax=Polaribacter sp. KT 15 TaxID=1896175 RepID=UPI00090AEC1F|nr:M56 family metallopeptidase [Polaribacter sp. KT 15]SHM79680.1 BlaR1 peptidase M56 [Polaribacter sp. KT 15]